MSSADLNEYYKRLEPLLEDNRLEEAVTVAEAAVKAAPFSGEPLIWLGDLYFEMDEWEKALASFEKALEIEPGLAPALAGAGKINFELCRFGEAERLINEALMEDNDLGEANYYKALLMERKGDLKKAEKFFDKAYKTDPDWYPSAFKISRNEFEKIAERTFKSLSPKVAAFIKNVAVIVEDFPSEDDLLSENPPLSPHILGLFRGLSSRERSVHSAWSEMPVQIVLYQRNLEHFCQELEELEEQIRITLLHEIGHYLGLNEKDLEKRGLN